MKDDKVSCEVCGKVFIPGKEHTGPYHCKECAEWLRALDMGPRQKGGKDYRLLGIIVAQLIKKGKMYSFVGGFVEGLSGGRPPLDVLKGTAASPGIVAGRVMNIYSEDEDKASFVRSGDVIVTEGGLFGEKIIDAIKKASAIITDRGGRACPARIIARELEKPAVVGTENATEQLRTGQQVIVDGSCGVVYLRIE